MAADLKIYPLDYDSSTPGVGDGPSVLDVAVNSLKSEAELTSLRQASSRRKTMQAAIGIQNIAVQVINGSLLFDPAKLASDSEKTPVAAQVTGSTGVRVSGVNVNAVSYSTNTVELWGDAIAGINQTVGSISSGNNAYFGSLKIQKLDFKLRTLSPQAYEFPIKNSVGQSYGLGTKSKGFWVGTHSSVPGQGVVTMQYESQVLMKLGVTMGNGSYYGGLSSASTGYAMNRYQSFSGEGQTIYALNYENELISSIGATTSAYSIRATSGNKTKGFVMGGRWFGPAVTEIQKLTFTTELVSTIGAVLSVARWNFIGFGSSTKGFVFGGGSGGTFYNTFETLNYDTETLSLVGNTDTFPAYSSATSDYYGGIE